jgi:hypothetical protein
MPMVLYWGKMQLIDRAYLLAHPVDSLVYLHSQPPVLNALALIVLHVSNLTGVSEAAVASGLFAALAFVRLGCSGWASESVFAPVSVSVNITYVKLRNAHRRLRTSLTPREHRLRRSTHNRTNDTLPRGALVLPPQAH